MKKKANEGDAKLSKKDDLPESLKYPSGEDIYNKEEKLSLDEEDPKTTKGKGRKMQGEDLDVPGSELDDSDELIGEEDEENNYYSLGGDDHNELEEDKGE